MTPFLIVGPERSGSFLLTELLDSHPDIVTGGELFNPLLIESGDLELSFGEPERWRELAEIRRRDPIRFVDEFARTAVESGASILGFKLLYSHLEKAPELRNHLVAETSIHIIHLTRVDLLRRYLSHQRAIETQQWRLRSGHTRAERPPTMELSFHDMVADFSKIEQWADQTRELFAGHPCHELTYEELAADPKRVGLEVVRFLGGRDDVDLEIRDQKTGGDPVEEAIENYDELKAHLERWGAFFGR